MNQRKNILVFQTAFLGDVILTLPMIQTLRETYPAATIDVVTTPKASEFVRNHPAVSSVIPFDKRQRQKGLRGILALAIVLRKRGYDTALVPHRSFRTAAVIGLSGIPETITFSTSAGKMFYRTTVPYNRDQHEVERNLALLAPLGITVPAKVLPKLYPSEDDRRFITKLLFDREIVRHERMIAVAPGSVWNTKRWLPERFAELALMLANKGYEVLIIGGNEDRPWGTLITETARHKHVHNVTGDLTLMQSAELIGRCSAIVTNDSAPLHIGVAMGTPVAAIFGATVPAFGFGPYGPHDTVIETAGLQCRPCAIHGGPVCPISTFDCMKNIDAARVYAATVALAERSRR